MRQMLEVIDKGSTTESHPTPLLFIHGAWHAAWCWNEHFLDFFADKGFHAAAVWRDIRLGIFCGAVAPQGAAGSSP
jgi:hypothetical protein